MIKTKLKTCAGCGPGKVIYKNINGEPYCKYCATKLNPPKTIRPRSLKGIDEDKIYFKQAAEFKDKHPCCVAKLPDTGCTGCQRVFLTIQHKKGRTGKLYLDMKHWIVVCLNCHHWINRHSEEAIELGLADLRLTE